jgi:hypothetical protein
LILAAAGAAALGAQSQHFDILITGAKVVNGSGSPWFYGDVGIRGDTIAAVGLIPKRTPPCASTPKAWWSRPASSISTRTAAAASPPCPPPRTTCAKASPRFSKARTAARRCRWGRFSTAFAKRPSR